MSAMIAGTHRDNPKYVVEQLPRGSRMDSVSNVRSKYRALRLIAAVPLALGCKPAGPRVQIVSPARGAVVSGNLLVALRASPGLHVVRADGSRKAGEGHFHVLVDRGP